MDWSGNASPLSAPTAHSPPAPLALSDFMAQTTPCSVITTPSDKPADDPQPGVVKEPSRSLLRDEPRPQTAPPQQPQHESQEPPPSPQEGSAPTDWLATRQQLLPRRNQGKKADWIRGWSESVTIHGTETYCACSEVIETNRGRKPKTSDLAVNVRAILRRTGSPPDNKNTSTTTTTQPVTPSEPEVCRHCSRPTSPPPSTDAASLASERQTSLSSRSLGKRVTEFLMRVKPSRQQQRSQSSSKHAHKRDAEIRNLAWGGPADCQPRWATTGQGQKRSLLVRPPSQPLANTNTTAAGPAQQQKKKSQSMDIFPGHNRDRDRGRGGVGRAHSPSSDDDLSDSEEAARRPGLARSMSRLQRAAALLQRATSRPKD